MWLCSADGGFITGQVLTVDGGFMLTRQTRLQEATGFMSLHFSLVAWEVKGTGAVWISDELHRELMERADGEGLRLLLRMRNAHADSGYAAYELDALGEELDALLQHREEFQPARSAAPLLPSARGLGELVEQLKRAVRLAQEWQSDIIVRCD